MRSLVDSLEAADREQPRSPWDLRPIRDREESGFEFRGAGRRKINA